MKAAGSVATDVDARVRPKTAGFSLNEVSDKNRFGHFGRAISDVTEHREINLAHPRQHAYGQQASGSANAMSLDLNRQVQDQQRGRKSIQEVNPYRGKQIKKASHVMKKQELGYNILTGC